MLDNRFERFAAHDRIHAEGIARMLAERGRMAADKMARDRWFQKTIRSIEGLAQVAENRARQIASHKEPR